MAIKRDKNGRFAKGNGGGPGRPKKERERRFYNITISACTFKDWEAIVKKAVEQAKDGDKDARRWLSDYLMGPPTRRLELEVEGAVPITIIEAVEPEDDGG